MTTDVVLTYEAVEASWPETAQFILFVAVMVVVLLGLGWVADRLYGGGGDE